ncbi:hypothetical protein ACFQVC_07030 [Streptomyces monticola]|uniref:PH domain-containing protein n=1 Tax=Streptomyces monticola TaxID=2666263 RepID=A0ABW2JFG3_9ACTN
MAQRSRRATTRRGRCPPVAALTTHNRYWARELRGATGCGVLFVAALLLLDWAVGDFTALRACLWTGLGALLFAVLAPARISAGPDVCESRGLFRTRQVCTACLVPVQVSPPGISQRLVLRDLHGRRLEIDPRVLVAQLWRIDRYGLLFTQHEQATV